MIVSTVLIDGQAYLITAQGEVFRVWFGAEEYPLIERLNPSDAKQLVGAQS